jgi:hypothetical protein
MHSIIYTFTRHVDSTTLADGDYQLIPEPEGVCSEDPGNLVAEPEGVCSEDPGNLVAEFSEAPNQGSEDINLTDPSHTSEGKPRT